MIEIDKYNLIILMFLYVVTFLISLLRLVYNLRKNSLRVSTFFEVYYILVYFITPICCLLNNGKKINVYNTTNEVKYFYFTYVIAIIGYIFLNVGINLKFKTKLKTRKEPNNILLSAFVLMIIGSVSLYLWTKVYGSMTGIFRYASQIRSGIVKIYNPYTFLKPLCPTVIIAFFIFYYQLFEFKNNKIYKNLFIFVGLVISGIGTYIYLIANDGRLMILIVLLVLILYTFNRNNKMVSKKAVLGYAILAIITIFILSNLNSITANIRGKITNVEKSNSTIIQIIANEFGYTYSNVINVMHGKSNGIIDGNTLLNDIKSAFFAWVPIRLKPKNIINLYDYNTSFYPGIIGQLPTDLLSAGMYEFGYIGIIILPLLVGIVSNLLNKYFWNKEVKFYVIMFYLISMYVGLRFIAYYDFSQILFGTLYIFISFIIIKVLNRIKLKSEGLNENII